MPRPTSARARARTLTSTRSRTTLATLVGTCALVPAAIGLLGACSTSGPTAPAPSGTTSELALGPAPSESLLPSEEPTSSTVGGLAPGFPTDLLPVPDGAEILVSSAEPVAGSDLVAVSLNLRSADESAALVETVRAALLAAGFTEAAAPAAGGLAAQASFGRSDGTEIVLVGVLDGGDVRTVTVSGRVRPTPGT